MGRTRALCGAIADLQAISVQAGDVEFIFVIAFEDQELREYF